MNVRIIIAILFALTLQTYSQDKEPQPMKFVWGEPSTYSALDPNQLTQDNFLTGFQWSGTPLMNHALQNNSAASGGIYWEAGTNYSAKRYLFNQPAYITIANDITGYQIGCRNAASMTWEPTLYIPKDSAGQFITRQNDSTNAIFGYHYIQGEILPANQYTDENYNRLKLRKDVIADTGLALNDIWPKPQFMTFNGGGQASGYQGQKWYLTINLKRADIAIDDTLDDA
ncbi:MAG: hypothetical protein QG635_85, partial [Bacteroidota bacterium]|nr:hypothetical protein [Bacteroidota bacterium]